MTLGNSALDREPHPLLIVRDGQSIDDTDRSDAGERAEPLPGDR